MILFVFILFCSYSLFSAMVIRDYCHHETFSSRCNDKNEIILIEEAQYGRMQLGICLEAEDLLSGNKSDYKFFGCYSDVTDILKKKCSGKKKCDMMVTDSEFLNTNDARVCYRSLFSYLRIKYQCVKIPSDERDCNVKITSESKHIMLPLQTDHLALESNSFCGHVTKPYNLEASIGQKININITKTEINDEHYLETSCLNGNKAIGYILARTDKINRNVSLCNNDLNNINKILFLEFKNFKPSVLKIVLFKWTLDNTIEDSIKNFILLEIKAIGCLDLIPPIDAWIKRSNDVSTVGCYSSRQTWKLKCYGYNWLGVIGNCTMFDSSEIHIEAKNNQIVSETIKTNSAEVQFLITVAMGVFAIIICLIIALLCCFLSKRCIRTKRKDFDKFPNITYHSNSTNCVIGQITGIPKYDNADCMKNKNECVDNANKKKEDYFILEENNL